jgi:hypothetical protein
VPLEIHEVRERLGERETLLMRSRTTGNRIRQIAWG